MSNFFGVMMLLLIILLCFEGSGTTVVRVSEGEHTAVCCFGLAFPRRDVALFVLGTLRREDVLVCRKVI